MARISSRHSRSGRATSCWAGRFYTLPPLAGGGRCTDLIELLAGEVSVALAQIGCTDLERARRACAGAGRCRSPRPMASRANGLNEPEAGRAPPRRILRRTVPVDRRDASGHGGVVRCVEEILQNSCMRRTIGTCIQEHHCHGHDYFTCSERGERHARGRAFGSSAAELVTTDRPETAFTVESGVDGRIAGAVDVDVADDGRVYELTFRTGEYFDREYPARQARTMPEVVFRLRLPGSGCSLPRAGHHRSARLLGMVVGLSDPDTTYRRRGHPAVDAEFAYTDGPNRLTES